MKTGLPSIASCLLLLALPAAAQTWSPPSPSERCPSKWGAADERGSANHMTPANVLRALKLVRTGEVIELNHVLSMDMPFFGTRRFDVHTKRTGGPMGSNKRYTNEEIVISEIGQVGTQFDMFSHQSIDNSHYNCFRTDEITTRNGFTRIGVDKVGSLITRGVLIDVAKSKNVAHLPTSYSITVADLQEALKKQGTTLRPGDVVLTRTGLMNLWPDVAKYRLADQAGLSLEAAQWLVESQQAMLVGADNFGVESFPSKDPENFVPVHTYLQAERGVSLLEALWLEDLSKDRVYEFLIIASPLKLKGGTASPIRPIAIPVKGR